MNNWAQSPRSLLAIAVSSAVLALVGCRTTAPDPALVAARAAVETASNNPTVGRYGQAEIATARDALQRAERAAEQGNERELRHRAYVAQQAATTATIAAQGRADDERVKLSSTERERVRLEARTREAQLATQQAQAAQQQASTAEQQVAQERARAAQLQQQLQALSAKQTDRGLVMTLSDVLFDTGRAELKAGSRRTLEQLATVLQKNPERRISIEGFTDSQGNDDYNMELSRRRAEAVRAALASAGVPSERMEVKPYGESFPVASNDNAAGRQANRRVEIVVSDESGQVRSR